MLRRSAVPAWKKAALARIAQNLDSEAHAFCDSYGLIEGSEEYRSLREALRQLVAEFKRRSDRG